MHNETRQGTVCSDSTWKMLLNYNVIPKFVCSICWLFRLNCLHSYIHSFVIFRIYFHGFNEGANTTKLGRLSQVLVTLIVKLNLWVASLYMQMLLIPWCCYCPVSKNTRFGHTRHCKQIITGSLISQFDPALIAFNEPEIEKFKTKTLNLSEQNSSCK